MNNTQTLKRNLKFLCGIALISMIVNISDGDFNIFDLLIGFIPPLVAYILVSKNNKYGGIVGIIIGILEIVYGIIIIFRFFNVKDSIDLNYKYLILIAPIVDILIGTIIAYESYIFHKEAR